MGVSWGEKNEVTPFGNEALSVPEAMWRGREEKGNEFVALRKWKNQQEVKFRNKKKNKLTKKNEYDRNYDIEKLKE